MVDNWDCFGRITHLTAELYKTNFDSWLHPAIRWVFATIENDTNGVIFDESNHSSYSVIFDGSNHPSHCVIFDGSNHPSYGVIFNDSNHPSYS